MPRSGTTKSQRQRKERKQQLPPAIQQTPIPAKSKKRWPLLIVLAIALILVSFGIWHVTSGSSASANTSPKTTLPTATPTSARTWQTVLTFSGGNETKNTQKFKVPSDWQITWSCKGTDGVDGGLFIVIYNTNGSLYNAGAQITCLASKQIIGSAEEFQSGYVYLNINSNAPWTVTVQKPQ